MLLLWSIRERYNPSSKFKIYFEALPANFNTGICSSFSSERNSIFNLSSFHLYEFPGLSFGIDALAALEGTLLFDELMQARQVIYCYGIALLILQITIELVWPVSYLLFQHLRQQYDELFPMLCIKFPDIFKQDVYTWDNFLWACELWYSNSMMVVLSSGKLTTCLIPIAGLLNHSVCNFIPELIPKFSFNGPQVSVSCLTFFFCRFLLTFLTMVG